MPKVDINGFALSSWASAQPRSSDQFYTVTMAGVAVGQFGLYFMGAATQSVLHNGDTPCVGGALTRSGVLTASGTFVVCNGGLRLQLTGAGLMANGLVHFDSVFHQALLLIRPEPLA